MDLGEKYDLLFEDLIKAYGLKPIIDSIATANNRLANKALKKKDTVKGLEYAKNAQMLIATLIHQSAVERKT